MNCVRLLKSATGSNKCFWDLTRMHSCAFSLVVNQSLMVLLAYTLVQAHLVLRQRQDLTRGVWERTWQLLSPTLEVVVVYYRQRFCLLTLAEFSRILLDIAESARGRLLEKLRRNRARTKRAVGNRALSVAVHFLSIRRCTCNARLWSLRHSALPVMMPSQPFWNCNSAAALSITTSSFRAVSIGGCYMPTPRAVTSTRTFAADIHMNASSAPRL